MSSEPPTVVSWGAEYDVQNCSSGPVIEPPTPTSAGAENDVTFEPRLISTVTFVSAGNVTAAAMLLALSEPTKICITGGASA